MAEPSDKVASQIKHPMSTDRITLVDIARKAKVSIFTVSCALRGQRGVASETAERVRKIAEELGYRPNAAARLLVGSRKQGRAETRQPVIAVIRFGADEMPEWPWQDAQMRAIAERQGYTLEVFRMSQYASPAELSGVLWARGVQGLILLTTGVTPNFPLQQMAGFQWDRFALVKISRGFDQLRCHTVRLSVFTQMRLALERVAEAGYRRVGIPLVSATASNEDDWSRRGAIEAFRQLRPNAFECMELFCVASIGEESEVNLREWLDRLRPDILVAFPFAWRFRLEQLGYRLPEDFAFVGVPVVNDSAGEAGRPTSGPLDDFLGLEFPAALHMLHDEIAAGRTGLPARPYEHVLPTVWQTGVTMPIPRPDRPAHAP